MKGIHRSGSGAIPKRFLMAGRAMVKISIRNAIRMFRFNFLFEKTGYENSGRRRLLKEKATIRI